MTLSKNPSRFLRLALLFCAPAALAQNIRRAAPAQGASVPAVRTLPQLNSSPITFKAGLNGALRVQPGLAVPGVIPQLQTMTPAPLELPEALVPAAELPELPAPSAPKTAFDRLAADVPLEPPPSSDWQGSRAFADDSFDFKLGAHSAETAAAADKAPEPETPADNGGGPDYPHNTVTFRKEEFRSISFRPNTPIEQDIVRMIQTAQKSIHLALYEFKLSAVLKALHDARKRGVEVHILLDYSNVFPQKQPDADYEPKRSREIWALLREGFDVKVARGLGPYGIMHNKFAVVDYNEKGNKPQIGEYGSYNWSWTAENSHYENAQFTTDKKRLDALMGIWKWVDAQAKPVKYESLATDYQWPNQIAPPTMTSESGVDLNGLDLPMVVTSPNATAGQSIEDWLVKAINATRKKLDVSIFAIRSTRIAQALAEAHGRGVAVRVIMDRGQSESEAFGPYARWLKAQGLLLKTLTGPDPGSDFPMAQKMHHKFSIFDGKVVETGSPNYTKYAAIGNFETGQFQNDAVDVKAYQFAFAHMWALAQELAPGDAVAVLPTDAELAAEIAKDIPAPDPRNDHPLPAPGVAARSIEFNGDKYDSYIFRPDKPIASELVKAIKGAKKSIRLALYEFSLDQVLDALRWVKANKPKVKIEIVIDRAHVYTSGTDINDDPKMPKAQILALIEEGFEPLILKGKSSGMQHNKFILIDASEGREGGLVGFGSYNLTDQSEDAHYENVNFATDLEKVQDFLSYFKYMHKLAEPIDAEKLKTVLERGRAEAMAEAAAEADMEIETDPEGAIDSEGVAGAKRGTPIEPPPQSQSKPVDFNGEKFLRTYFSPQGGIMDAWLRAIKASKSSIEIAMFSFYSRTISDALVEALKAAKKANPELKITVVLDEGQTKLTRINGKFDGLTVAQWLSARGLDAMLISGPNPQGDPLYEKQHNKFMIADRKMVMTGSFNLSDNAEVNNFENENILTDPTDVAGFVDFFARMLSRSRKPEK